MSLPPGALLRACFDAAVEAAQPRTALPPHLPPVPSGRTVVVGAGKAAAAMAAALEDHWPAPLQGLVVTPYGHGLPCTRIEVIEAAHPVPDSAGQAAARRMLDSVSGLRAEDLVLALISGGGSALLSLPAPGITLAEKQAITGQLLRCGATIHEINTVRKHLSAIKGGRLGAACAPARLHSLVISDVPGDDPADIASGPTVADPSSRADALAVLERHAIDTPAGVLRHLHQPAAETPKPGDPALRAAGLTLIATPRLALDAAARRARDAGLEVSLLGDALQGESRLLAAQQAQAVRDRLQAGISRPLMLISGGETTVTVRGQGRGGRNAEFALALALALDGQAGVHAIACDTDGIDGNGDHAGAIIGPDTLARARKAGADPAASLANNDAYGLFSTLGDLLFTGPTRTNVNDFRAILILP